MDIRLSPSSFSCEENGGLISNGAAITVTDLNPEFDTVDFDYVEDPDNGLDAIKISKNGSSEWGVEFEISKYEPEGDNLNPRTIEGDIKVTVTRNYIGTDEEPSILKQSLVHYTIIQSAPLPDIQLPPLSDEDDEKTDEEKEAELQAYREQCLKEAEELEEKLKASLIAMGAQIIEIGVQFVNGWIDKLMAIWLKIDSQFASAQKALTNELYNLGGVALKLQKLNRKIRLEKLKLEAEQDSAMLENWESKFEDLVQDFSDLLETLDKKFECKDVAGASAEINKIYILNNEKVSQKDIVDFINRREQIASLYWEDKADFFERVKQTFSASNLKQMLLDKFREYKENLMAIVNVLKQMVVTSATAIVEPLGDIVVTPMGPGAVTANIIMVSNVIKKIKASAMATFPMFGICMAAAAFLHLPPSFVEPLKTAMQLMTVISMLPTL